LAGLQSAVSVCRLGANLKRLDVFGLERRDSVGHWEGNTLVVSTDRMNLDFPFHGNVPLVGHIHHDEGMRITQCDLGNYSLAFLMFAAPVLISG
jgi:hypothetical protein